MEANAPLETTISTYNRKGQANDKVIKVTLAVDKMYLSLLPKIFISTLQQYNKKAKQSTEERGGIFQEQWMQQLLELKPLIIQRGITGLLTTHAKHVKRKLKNATKQSITKDIQKTRTNSVAIELEETQPKRQRGLHRCKGTLCQKRMIWNRSILPSTVSKDGAWCVQCQEEREGWKLAEQLETLLLRKRRREIMTFTNFLDANYNKDKVSLASVWGEIKPLMEELVPYATEYPETTPPLTGRLREAIEIVAKSLCLHLHPYHTIWTWNVLTTQEKQLEILEKTKDRQGHYRLCLILKLNSSRTRLQEGINLNMDHSRTNMVKRLPVQNMIYTMCDAGSWSSRNH